MKIDLDERKIIYGDTVVVRYPDKFKYKVDLVRLQYHVSKRMYADLIGDETALLNYGLEDMIKDPYSVTSRIPSTVCGKWKQEVAYAVNLLKSHNWWFSTGLCVDGIFRTKVSCSWVANPGKDWENHPILKQFYEDCAKLTSKIAAKQARLSATPSVRAKPEIEKVHKFPLPCVHIPAPNLCDCSNPACDLPNGMNCRNPL